jgi:sortase A
MERMRPERARVLSSALLLAGIALLLYVGVQYGSMYRGQERLAREWAQQQERSFAPGVPHNLLTRLTIPKIDLDSVIVEGTNRKALLLGPGHMADTAVPGEPGNAVITGHRDTFFRHIYELDKGDSILVQRAGKIYQYEVTGKKVVEPDDLSVIRPSPDARLTLITCYPIYYIGPAPKRLVVFAKMAGQEENAPAIPATEPIKQAGAAR